MKPLILYYHCLHYSKENLDLLNKLFNVYMLTDPRYDGKLPETVSQKIEGIFLPLGFKFGAPQRGRFPMLRVIASNTTTTPQVETDGIDVIYLDNPTFLDTITSTAEYTLGLILAAHRLIPAAHRSAQVVWNRYEWGTPKMLSRSNLTIWGMGRVGKHLRHRTRNLFRVVWEITENDSDEYINNTLTETDVLAITMSAVGPQPVVNKDKLERLPEQAIVVNTSRGEVLDLGALLRLLATGKLRAAGLDVLERDHAFAYGKRSTALDAARQYTKRYNNLILTPHIAGSTEDAWHETQRYVIDLMKEILL